MECVLEQHEEPEWGSLLETKEVAIYGCIEVFRA